MLAGGTDKAGLAKASEAAIDLGLPVLLTPKDDDTLGDASLSHELQRLKPATLVTFGAAAKAWADRQAPVWTPGATVLSDPSGKVTLPEVSPAQPLAGLTVLATNTSTSAAAIAVAKASGARVLLVKGSDPRADGAAIKALHEQPADHIVAIGSAFGPADRLRARVETATTGVTLPGGGQLLFPGHRMIALYGHPGDGGLGVLGEQGVTAAIARAKRVAASYEPYLDGTVVPAFEIITTVASSGAGSDGDYSRESSIAQIQPWVDAARRAGVYVMLDLQPGRTDFLTQAKRYEKLLLEPNVGLALDPEWRLKKDQVHLEQIGSVSSSEINKTGEWLAQLTRAHHLPQKIFMVHQFTLKMIGDRSALKTNYDELAVVIHADGFGSRGAKFNTWNALHVDAPKHINWGWKNFYDEDKPTFTPKQTSAVRPTPVFVSYQ
jgi:hypothetical protein